MNNCISINFIYLRKRNYLSRAEFANKHGVSYGAQGSYEQGVSLPPITLIQSICSEYGVSIDDFVNIDLSKTTAKKDYVVNEDEGRYGIDEKTEQIYNKIIAAKDDIIKTKESQILDLKKRESDLMAEKEKHLVTLIEANQMLKTLFNQNNKN